MVAGNRADPVIPLSLRSVGHGYICQMTAHLPVYRRVTVGRYVILGANVGSIPATDSEHLGGGGVPWR